MMRIRALIVRFLRILHENGGRLRLLSAFLLVAQSARFQPAQSAFDDLGVGARAPAMADAFTAVADDANAVLYNPAGLVQLMDGEITTQYGQLLRGLDDGSSLGTTFLGFAHPLRRGYSAFGAAYHNFKADNLFNERTLVLSYGQRFNAELFGRPGILSGGLNLKQLYRQYQPDRFTENALNDAGTASGRTDPLFGSGYGKAAYASDLGLLYQFGPRYDYTAGLAVTNINRPDVSISGDGDKAPQIMKLSGAYRPRWGTATAEFRRAKRLASKSDTELAFGLERNIHLSSLGAFVLRGGYAEGSRDFKSLTAGLAYMYSRFRLDYAFNFPINNLSDTQGSHRIGFTFGWGSAPAAETDKDYSGYNLLTAFMHDSLTSHVLLTRLSLARRLMPTEKDQMLLLLMRRYSLEDPGLKDVRSDLRNLIRRREGNVMDWPQLKFAFLSGVPTANRLDAGQALELLVQGEPKSTLARLALMPDSAQKNTRMSAVALVALAEVAAQAYRAGNIDVCIDQVRRMVDMLPADEVVMKAYRLLLLMRNRPSEEMVTSEPESIAVSEELPEAPRTLVAPEPQGQAYRERPISEKEVRARNYATALGYYLIRKSEGATPDELLHLLNQMKAVYGPTGMDISIVEKELESLGKVNKAPGKPIAPKPVPVKEAPAKPVTPKPVNVAPPVKPVSTKIIIHPDLDRAWDYYRQAVDRNITDHEKIEILEAMLLKFGEKGAENINKELQRIRRRLQ